MDKIDEFHHMVEDRVQFGPLYRCWICDRPVGRVRPYHECVPEPTDMDAWAEHVGYLKLHPFCIRAKHPCRVATIGAAITPLHWVEGAAWEAKVQTVESRITFLSQKIEEEGRDADGDFDPLLVLLSSIYARTLTPQQALVSLRVLSQETQTPVPEYVLA